MATKPATEAIAGSALLVLALVAAQNARNGTLRNWLGAKFLNRGEVIAGSGVARGVAAPAGTVAPPGTVTASGPFENGKLPDSALASISEGGHRLAPAAAAGYIAMKAAAKLDGVTLKITDSYRSYAAQVACKIAKPFLCATPGTSVHGWGKAIDVASGGGRREWVQQNGARFGWIWPAWARPGGSKPEPWHFEHSG